MPESVREWIQFAWRALARWWIAITMLELLVGGWDTATEHIDVLDGMGVPVVTGLSAQTWLAIVAVTLSIGVIDGCYRQMRAMEAGVRPSLKALPDCLVAVGKVAVPLDQAFLCLGNPLLFGVDNSAIVDELILAFDRENWQKHTDVNVIRDIVLPLTKLGLIETATQFHPLHGRESIHRLTELGREVQDWLEKGMRPLTG